MFTSHLKKVFWCSEVGKHLHRIASLLLIVSFLLGGFTAFWNPAVAGANTVTLDPGWRQAMVDSGADKLDAVTSDAASAGMFDPGPRTGEGHVDSVVNACAPVSGSYVFHKQWADTGKYSSIYIGVSPEGALFHLHPSYETNRTNFVRTDNLTVFDDNGNQRYTISLRPETVQGKMADFNKVCVANHQLYLAGSDDYVYVFGVPGGSVNSSRLVARWGGHGTGHGQLDRLGGISVSGDWVYAVDTFGDLVQVLGPNGTFVGQWGEPGAGDGQFDGPMDVAVYGDRVYVTDNGNSRVQVFDLGGRYITQWGSPGSGDGQFNLPNGITVHRDRVYVADTFNDRVQVFDLGGRYITQFSSTGTGAGILLAPYSVVANKDYVYVSDANGIEQYLIPPNPLEVVSTTPEDGAVFPANNVVVNFNMPVYSWSVNANNFTVKDAAGNTIPGTYDASGDHKTYTFIPSEPFTSSYYTCTLTSGITSEYIDPTTGDYQHLPTGYSFGFLTKKALSGFLLYQINKHLNTVSVLDPKTYVRITDISVGSGPVSMDFFNDGKTAVLVYEQSSNLTLINTLSNQVIRDIRLPYASTSVAVSPDNMKAYVTHGSSGNISEVDLTTGKTRPLVTSIAYPVSVTLNPEGTRAYVCNYNESNLTVIDLASRSVIGTVDVGNSPVKAVLTPDGRSLYVVCPGDNTLSVVDVQTNGRIATIRTGNSPSDIVFDNSDCGYVLNTDDSTVSVISLRSLKVLKTINVQNRPTSIATGPLKQYILTANTGDDSLSYIEASTMKIIDTRPTKGTPTAIFFNPCVLVVDHGELHEVAPPFNKDSLDYVHLTHSAPEDVDSVLMSTAVSCKNRATYNAGMDAWEYDITVSGVAAGRLEERFSSYTIGTQSLEVNNTYNKNNLRFVEPVEGPGPGAYPFLGQHTDYSTAYGPARQAINRLENLANQTHFGLSPDEFTRALTSGTSQHDVTPDRLYLSWDYRQSSPDKDYVANSGYVYRFKVLVLNSSGDSSGLFSIESTAGPAADNALHDSINVSCGYVGNPNTMTPDMWQYYGIENRGGTWVSSNPPVRISSAGSPQSGYPHLKFTGLRPDLIEPYAPGMARLSSAADGHNHSVSVEASDNVYFMHNPNGGGPWAGNYYNQRYYGDLEIEYSDALWVGGEGRNYWDVEYNLSGITKGYFGDNNIGKVASDPREGITRQKFIIDWTDKCYDDHRQGQHVYPLLDNSGRGATKNPHDGNVYEKLLARSVIGLSKAVLKTISKGTNLPLDTLLNLLMAFCKNTQQPVNGQFIYEWTYYGDLYPVSLGDLGEDKASAYAFIDHKMYPDSAQVQYTLWMTYKDEIHTVYGYVDHSTYYSGLTTREMSATHGITWTIPPRSPAEMNQDELTRYGITVVSREDFLGKYNGEENFPEAYDAMIRNNENKVYFMAPTNLVDNNGAVCQFDINV